MNIITGIYVPTAGDIRLNGQSIAGLAPHEITRRGLARTFQSLRLFLNMSVIENVMAAAFPRTMPPLAVHIAHSGLSARGGADPCSWLRKSWPSSASACKAIASISRPTAFLRQSPPAGNRPRYGDRAETAAARRAGRRNEPERNRGDHPNRSANCVTRRLHHPADRARYGPGRGISDRVIALDYGQKIAEGSFEAVATDERVIEAYLGRKGDKVTGDKVKCR